MAKKVILNSQSSTDAAMLTYGKQDAFFKLHEDNEDVIVDLLQTVPEIPIPAIFTVGNEIEFDENDVLYDINVAKTYKREPIKVATNKNENLVQDKGGFSIGFNNGFKVWYYRIY